MLQSLYEPDRLRDPVVQAEIHIHSIDTAVSQLFQLRAADVSHLANDMRALADRLETLARQSEVF